MTSLVARSTSIFTPLMIQTIALHHLSNSDFTQLGTYFATAIILQVIWQSVFDIPLRTRISQGLGPGTWWKTTRHLLVVGLLFSVFIGIVLGVSALLWSVFAMSFVLRESIRFWARVHNQYACITSTNFFSFAVAVILVYLLISTDEPSINGLIVVAFTSDLSGSLLLFACRRRQFNFGSKPVNTAPPDYTLFDNKNKIKIHRDMFWSANARLCQVVQNRGWLVFLTAFYPQAAYAVAWSYFATQPSGVLLSSLEQPVFRNYQSGGSSHGRDRGLAIAIGFATGCLLLIAPFPLWLFGVTTSDQIRLNLATYVFVSVAIILNALNLPVHADLTARAKFYEIAKFRALALGSSAVAVALLAGTSVAPIEAAIVVAPLAYAIMSRRFRAGLEI